MVLHSSVATATAAAHLQDLLADARRHRATAGATGGRRTTGAVLRRIVRGLVHAPAARPGPVSSAHPANSDADRRYAVPR